MEYLLEDIKKSIIWTKLHNATSSDDIMSYICSNDVDYSLFDKFIDSIVNNSKIEKGILRPKLIVSILMIAKYPDSIIGSELGTIENNIVKKAQEIYDKFLGNDLYEIHKKLITFKIMFDDWKLSDKKNQLDLLCQLYYSYTDSLLECDSKDLFDCQKIEESYKDDVFYMTLDEKHTFISEILAMRKQEYSIFVNQVNSMRNKILHSMKNLTPDYKIYLKRYNHKNIQFDKNIRNVVKHTMENVYWDNIKKDIFIDKSHLVYNKIIYDYIQLVDKIDTNIIDKSYIFSLQEKHITDDNIIDSCCELCVFILNNNIKLDSENYDDIYKNLLEKISKDSRYVTDILKICFNRLKIIKKIQETIHKL